MKNLVLLFGIICLFSCKKDDPPPAPPSAEKEVLTFEARNTEGNAFTIKNSPNSNQFIIEPMCPTNENAIKINLTVSPKATCSLASGSVLDLRTTQTFTVTAEDGSKKEYIIFVQGATLYSSHYYECNSKKDIPCTFQKDYIDPSFTNNRTCVKSGLYPCFDLYLKSPFQDRFNVVIVIGDYLASTTSDFNSNMVGEYDISSGEATFHFEGQSIILQNVSTGKIKISHVDTKNKLISGSFDFYQDSNTSAGCSVNNNTDHLVGQFYSLSY
jgi:hypothetical protein